MPIPLSEIEKPPELTSPIIKLTRNNAPQAALELLRRIYTVGQAVGVNLLTESCFSFPIPPLHVGPKVDREEALHAFIRKTTADRIYRDIALGVIYNYLVGNKNWLFPAIKLGKSRLLQEPSLQALWEEWQAEAKKGDVKAKRNLRRLSDAVEWVGNIGRKKERSEGEVKEQGKKRKKASDKRVSAAKKKLSNDIHQAIQKLPRNVWRGDPQKLEATKMEIKNTLVDRACKGKDAATRKAGEWAKDLIARGLL